MICFSRSYKMFNIRIFFFYFIVLYLLLFITLTANNINKRIRNGIFDLIVIIADLLKSFGLTNIVNYNASFRTFIVMGNNCSINLLTTCIVVIIPSFLTLFDIVIDRKCCHARIVIKVMLVPCKERRFSCCCQSKNDDFIFRNILSSLTVKRTPTHHNVSSLDLSIKNFLTI